MFKVNEQYRVVRGIMASNSSIGNNGQFILPHPKIKDYYFITIASDQLLWEHVSVTIYSKRIKVDRCPTWEEMCWLKDQFCDEEDTFCTLCGEANDRHTEGCPYYIDLFNY